MAEITTPAPLKPEELRVKAEALYRSSYELPQPLPLVVLEPQGGVDPEATDHIASQAFSRLYNSDKYSDLVIKCQDRVWRAHKAVVCSQSKVLAACVDGPFREAQTGEIDLSEDEPEIVEHMIEYLYKGFYDFETPLTAKGFTPEANPVKPYWMSRIWKKDTAPSVSNPLAAFPDVTPQNRSLHANNMLSSPTHQSNLKLEGHISPTPLGATAAPTPPRLVTHASVYCIADQYDIPRLKNFALCKYAALAPTSWNSPFFIPSLKIIYERTPSRFPIIDDLRAVAAKTVASNSQYFLDQVDFLECCVENAEIAVDIMRMVLVLKQREFLVDWKVKVKCPVAVSHEVIYLPQLVGFGVNREGASGGSMGMMLGFGRSTGGTYKCLRCGNKLQ